MKVIIMTDLEGISGVDTMDMVSEPKVINLLWSV